MDDIGPLHTAVLPMKTLDSVGVERTDGAYLVHSERSGPLWTEVRSLILACAELPIDGRETLVRLGDEYASAIERG